MKRRPASLTQRLTLLFGVAAGLVLSGFGLVIERSINHHFIAEDTAELEVIADAVSDALSMQGGTGTPRSLEQRFNDTLIGHHGAILYVTDGDDQTLFASHGATVLSLARPPDAGNDGDDAIHQWNGPKHSYRILTRRIQADTPQGRENYVFSVAVTIDSHQRFFENFNHTLWAMIASGIVMTGLMGWFAVRQGHAPLRRIIAQIHTISGNELNTRLDPDSFPRELTELAASFNDMLERMDQSFQKLSNYAADIAHELRTPVTSMLTQTQVSLSKSRTVEEYREVLYSNIEEYEHMAQMINDMLLLAKIDNGLYNPGTDLINLGDEIQQLFDYYEAWAEESNVTLSLEGDITVHGDKLMLRRAIGNLLSNAIKHTPPGQSVKVNLHHDNNQFATITVENPGTPIPSEHIPRLFERFYRSDSALRHGNEGVGLGLAISKAIVDIHRGGIRISSTPERTQFIIYLPLM